MSLAVGVVIDDTIVVLGSTAGITAVRIGALLAGLRARGASARATAEHDEKAVTPVLQRPFFGPRRVEWKDGSTEFHVGHGAWIRLLRQNGFDVEDLIEVQPPEGATTRFPYVTLDWARRWPSEEVWKVRKRA